MALCDINVLKAQAVANGFGGLSRKAAKLLELQLWYNLVQSSDTIAELKEDACANGFSCIFGRSLKAAKAQLLCNLSEGMLEIEDCINLMPDGAMYGEQGVGGRYNFYNNSSLSLTIGNFYSITWGENEGILQNGTTIYNNTGIGTSTTFVYQLGFYLISVNGDNIPVTAIICEV